MKIFISADIEGVTGICDWNETELNLPDHDYFRHQMTKEVVACCEGLFKAGVNDITVRDAHDSARNILPDLLPKGVKLIRGWTEGPCDMMAGLDESYDGVIFIGYHSPARSSGNPLSHTLMTSFNHIKLNNEIVSEFLLNTYYARIFDVPVIMLTGDDNLTSIAQDEKLNIETVATNVGMHGAVMARQVDDVCDEIKEKAVKAIYLLNEKKSKLIEMPKSFTCEIHFKQHKKAYKASFYPGAYQVESDKTGYSSDEYLDVLKFIMFNE